MNVIVDITKQPCYDERKIKNRGEAINMTRRNQQSEINDTIELLAELYISRGYSKYEVIHRIIEDTRRIFGGQIEIEGHIDFYIDDDSEQGFSKTTVTYAPGIYFLFYFEDMSEEEIGTVYIKYEGGK